ncbi:MAG: Halocyanin [Myxococcaceae bacterium]|nr:Halocyanin [Myxococcaceae bacterium]
MKLIQSNRQNVLTATLVALTLLGCGDDSGDSYAPTGSDAGGRADASSPLDAAQTSDATARADAAAIPTLNGCSAADYLDKSGSADSRTVQIASMGLSYTPKCITIARGQSVTWTGSLTAHPLAPGNAEHTDAGSPGSPILPTATGSSVSFTFPNAGTYPYYCEIHGFGNGDGMSGSIHVQ